MMTYPLEKLIEKLMQRYQVPILYPGEFGYVRLASRLIAQEISAWFYSNGINKKIPTLSAQSWVRRHCPDWVIAALNQRLNN